MTVTEYRTSPNPPQTKSGEKRKGFQSKAVSTFQSPLSMTATIMNNPCDTLSKLYDQQLQEKLERNQTLKLSTSTKN